MMLVEEGKDNLREDFHRFRAMKPASNLGLNIDFCMMVPRGASGQDECSTVRRQCPVQLDLLPIRPVSHSHASSLPASASGASAPSQPTNSGHVPFTWQRLYNNRSRSPSRSETEDVEVAETYSSGHGGSPRGIDMNQMPSREDCDDVVTVSSPNSTNDLKRGRERTHDLDLERDRACDMSCRGSDEEEGGTTRKKLRLSKEQSALLEESFKEHSTLNPKQKNALAKQLSLRPRQVEVWFQNRRARTKLKQTEVDCEMLKRCYENLTEENRKLKKEVAELRALKMPPSCMIPPDYYMQVPAATLTICPSCERLTSVDSKGVSSFTFTKPGAFSSHSHSHSPHPVAVHSHFAQSSANC